MRRALSLLGIFAFVLIACASAAPSTGTPGGGANLVPLIERRVVFETPTQIQYDSSADVYLSFGPKDVAADVPNNPNDTRHDSTVKTPSTGSVQPVLDVSS